MGRQITVKRLCALTLWLFGPGSKLCQDEWPREYDLAGTWRPWRRYGSVRSKVRPDDRQAISSWLPAQRGCHCPSIIWPKGLGCAAGRYLPGWGSQSLQPAEVGVVCQRQARDVGKCIRFRAAPLSRIGRRPCGMAMRRSVQTGVDTVGTAAVLRAR